MWLARGRETLSAVAILTLFSTVAVAFAVLWRKSGFKRYAGRSANTRNYVGSVCHFQEIEDLNLLSAVVETVPHVFGDYLGLSEMQRMRAVGRMCRKLADAYILWVRSINTPSKSLLNSALSSDACLTNSADFFTMLDIPLVMGRALRMPILAAVFERAINLPEVLDARDCAGRSPIMKVAQSGSVCLAETLLAARADLSARGGNGWSPLHFAAVGGNVELGRLLLRRRADINLRSFDGYTALAYAREAGHDSFADELLSYGAAVCRLDHKEGG